MDSPESSRDEDRWRDLIGRVAGADEAALGALYDATGSMVYGLALRILADEHMAEEVTLDVFSQVWRRAGTYDPSRGRPTTWLLTMTRSRAIDRVRSSQKDRRGENLEEHLDLVDPGPDPEAATEVSDQGRKIRAALALLTREQRQAIELAFYSGLTHQEVAERLGEPLGTVKTRIRNGLIRLRDALKPLADETSL